MYRKQHKDNIDYARTTSTHMLPWNVTNRSYDMTNLVFDNKSIILKNKCEEMFQQNSSITESGHKPNRRTVNYLRFVAIRWMVLTISWRPANCSSVPQPWTCIKVKDSSATTFYRPIFSQSEIPTFKLTQFQPWAAKLLRRQRARWKPTENKQTQFVNSA